ncbi:tryptophan--tRNA ligase [Solilutibacter silvestris]|uniref:Tryptophan--tRNA ligase n=1 Tax=Solilutibacter silvestris TaxID=1645665 RepID=A0A2K1Q291_9GAMM|nr:tryptophan--tRNA ligase [Lysobacter silvestris]PNS09170.1 trpS: tryptophan--tRNA ligase [Lysobacter silvestris]
MDKRKTRILTGITTSGTPHLGNYVGAIRPAIAASRADSAESFYFLADLHSLIKAQDPARTQRSTLEIAASWLACGLDPQRVWFYRQSDIPEISELTWFLTCVAGKGILNRAHAYKAAVDKNRADGEDDDAGITAGLFMYPVLMAADILIFNANRVPVGRDQIQHIEMARDFGQRFNHIYGHEYFALPEALVDDDAATLSGLDGRKMSKSYNNTIPLFAPREQLKKLVFSMLTDSRAPGEAKDREGSPLFQLYKVFASTEETAAFAQAYADGIGWGDAKQRVFEVVDREIAPLRECYDDLMTRPQEIEAILRDGARRLRERYAMPFIAELREAVGLRDLSSANVAVEAKPEGAATDAPVPTFKQYREADGKFYFKLMEGDRLLLVSIGFDSPRDAGQRVAAMKEGALEGGEDFRLADGVSSDEVNAALARFVAAQLAQE